MTEEMLQERIDDKDCDIPASAMRGIVDDLLDEIYHSLALLAPWRFIDPYASLSVAELQQKEKRRILRSRWRMALLRLRCRFHLHDYPVSRGGDGEPKHFYQYICWNCGEKFSI